MYRPIIGGPNQFFWGWGCAAWPPWPPLQRSHAAVPTPKKSFSQISTTKLRHADTLTDI